MASTEGIPEPIYETVEKLMEVGPLVTDFVREELDPVIEYWISLLKTQRMLLDLDDVSTLVVGDIHGDYLQLRRAFKYFDDHTVDQIVINGDLIDRGAEMIECVEYVVSRQILDPTSVFYVRGNHELKSINEMYGFRGYCTGVYGSAVYEKFSKGFQQLPLAAKLGDWAFICHGGIPSETIYFHLMRLELKEQEPEMGPYAELLWNDPDPRIDEFATSPRGKNYYRFGKVAFDQFMEFHELDYLIRAHQAFPEGYRWFYDDRLLSVFSSNAGPYMNIDPHFALLNKGKIDLIQASTIEVDLD